MAQDRRIETAFGLFVPCRLRAGMLFGMTEKTFRAVRERQPEVSTAYRKGRANKIAQVASQLMKAVNLSGMRAIQFFLKTQAGWTEKSHLELFKAEEPVGTQWTINVADASTRQNCGVDHQVFPN